MILTITMNPSVDIRYPLQQLSLNTVNRAGDVSKTAGGKGLNVARVLRQLGEPTAATGFLGGRLGDFIRDEISKLNIDDYFIPIEGNTRNCIAVLHDNQQTEILESGPVIQEKEGGAFLEQLERQIKNVDIITISGSLPKGLPDHFYVDLLEIAGKNNKLVLLDVKGDLLATTLKSGRTPHLIKPNEEELTELLRIPLEDESAIMEAVKDSELLRPIPWVVITMGSKGALVKHENTFYHVTIPKVEAKNPVGSGDSVIAGFAAGLSRGYDNKELIKFGLAMGVLNAMEEKTGYINTEKIEWCTQEIKVE